MRLDESRLCLDCEEIHQDHVCPACGSEAFAFLTRWIQSTAPARSKAPRPTLAPTEQASRQSEQLAAWREITDGTPATAGRGSKIVTRGLLGLAAMGIAGWAWSKTTPSDDEES